MKTTHDAAKPGQYLSFSLGKEDYAIPLQSVFEINGLTSITPVPQTPPFIAGVINLRGKIVPVVNLRISLGMELVPFTKETCVIITDSNGRHVGMIVDTVNEVLNLTADLIAAKPEMGDGTSTTFITGMAKLNDKVTILMEISGVMSHEEMNLLTETAKAA